MSHKVVLQYKTGVYAGMYQIYGHDADIPVLPSSVDNITFLDGRVGSATLVELRDHYVLYREVVPEPVEVQLDHEEV